MNVSNLSALSFPMPESYSQLCGHCSIINDTLLLFSGYNIYDLWTSNFSGNFNLQNPFLEYGYKIHLSNREPTYELAPFDSTRFIGSAMMYSAKNHTITHGGSYQTVHETEQGKLQIKISNYLILTAWNSLGGINSYSMLPIKQENQQLNDQLNKTSDINQNIDTTSRIFHGSALDAERKLIWIFGGINIAKKSTTLLNDLIYITMPHATSHQIHCEPPINTSGFFNNLVYKDNFLYTVTEDYIWAMDLHSFSINGENSFLKWEKYAEIPKEMRRSLNGASVFICSSPLKNEHLMIVGGTIQDLYLNIALSYKINESKDKNIKLQPLRIISYCFTTKLFNEFNFNSSIHNVSYHAYTVDSNFLYISGGINNSIDELSFVINKDIYLIRWSDLFVKEIKSIPLNPLTNYDTLLNVENETVNAVLSKIDETFISNGYKILYQNYKRHCAHPFPISDYITCGKYSCYLPILKSRMKTWYPEYATLPQHYINDLFMYLLTDCIDPTLDRPLEFKQFLTFICLLRENKLYRLIWMEISLQINKMTLPQFIELCTEQTYISTLVDDRSLVILKILLIRILNNTPYSHISGALIGKLMRVNNFSKYLTEKLNEREIPLNFNEPMPLPASTFISETCFIIGHFRCYKCNDGKLFFDNSELPLEDYSNFRYQIVYAVYTHNVEHCISTEIDFHEVFTLINQFKNLTAQLVSRIFASSKTTLMKSLEQFSDLTSNYIAHMMQMPIVEFIVRTLGENLTCIIKNTQGQWFGISKICARQQNFPGVIFSTLSFQMMLYLAILIYNSFDIERLKGVIFDSDIALILLDFIAMNKKLINIENTNFPNFIIQNMFTNVDGTLNYDAFAEHFTLCFKSGLHERIINLDPYDEWATYLLHNYSDKLKDEEKKWIQNKIDETENIIQLSQKSDEADHSSNTDNQASHDPTNNKKDNSTEDYSDVQIISNKSSSE